MEPDAVVERLRRLGFSAADAGILAAHFLDADRRGKPSHGVARIDWLETFTALDPGAEPEKVVATPGFDLWEGRGALGYLTLARICDDLVSSPPSHVRVVAAAQCFPTGMLGYWVRVLANAGMAAQLTATSPARLPHPDGGEPLVGTNPLAIGIPSSGGDPLVVDVSMGKVTHGDVLRGTAQPGDLVPFGGEQAHKAFALAVGLQGWVESFVGTEPGAVLVVAQPAGDEFVPALRARAAGLRLPGDS